MSKSGDIALKQKQSTITGGFSSFWYRFHANRPLFWSFLLVLGWRLLLEVDNYVFPRIHLFPAPEPSAAARLHLGQWARWDGGWYLDVIVNGYRHIHIASGQQNFVFFPIFPIITRWVALFLNVKNPIYVGLAINLLLTIGIALFLYKISNLIVQRYGSAQQKKRAEYIAVISIVALLLYPSTLFFAAFYSESFLIFGAAGAVYFALKDQLVYASIFAGISTGSKSLGLVVLPAIAIIAFEHWRIHQEPLKELVKSWLYILIGLWGLVAYAAYLAFRFGDALLPFKLEKAWGRESGFFLTNIIQRYYAHIFQLHYFGDKYTYMLNLIVMALPFLILAAGIWPLIRYKTFWPLVFGFFALAMPLSTGTMQSLNRYIMIVAPIIPFVILGVTSKRFGRVILYGVLSASFVLLMFFTAGFLQGSYFAG